MLYLKEKKLFLEIYGLIRMSLGLAQIVGLAAAYFLTEIVLQYPADSLLYIMDEELIALVSLAVILRAIFHMVAGIGIARMQFWGRMWLLYGWPLMILMTFGVAHALRQSWIEDGYIAQGSPVLAWPGIFIYVVFVGIDVVFVNQSIKVMNQNHLLLEDVGGRIEPQKVTVVFFIAVVSMILLMFLGGPIKKGFHKGFYKSRGKEVSQGGKETKVLKSKSSRTTNLSRSTAKQVKDPLPPKAKDESSGVYTRAKVVSMRVDEKDQTGTAKRVLKTSEVEKQSQSMPYRKTMGFVGGIFLIIGFFFQIFEIKQSGQAKSGAGASYILCAIGFLLWIIYGMTSQLLVISLTSVILFILSIVLAVMTFLFRPS